MHYGRESRGDTLTQIVAIFTLQNIAIVGLDAVVTPIAHQAQRTASQLVVGIDALIGSLQMIGHTEIPIQDREFFERLPLVIIDLAWQNRHRFMVADGVIELHRLPLILTQHIPHTSKESLATQDVGILAVDNLIVVVVSLDHGTVILGRCTILEKS